MKTKHGFYLLGVLAAIKGILVLLGVDLPRRDGTMIENPTNYAENAILFGIFVILLTFLVVKIKSRKNDQ